MPARVLFFEIVLFRNCGRLGQLCRVFAGAFFSDPFFFLELGKGCKGCTLTMPVMQMLVDM